MSSDSLGSTYILYQKVLCLLLVCTSPTFQVFLLLASRESQLFGI